MTTEGDFRGRPCIYCRAPSSRRGEHVIPQGVNNALFPTSDGPYTIFVNGQQTTDRHGEPASQPALGRIRVPCCDETHNGCNRVLEERFEQSAQKLVVDLLAASRNGASAAWSCSAAERAQIALWMIKTVLLRNHPGTISTDGTSPESWDLSRDDPNRLFGWMVSGDDPPPGVSLWIASTVAPCPDHLRSSARILHLEDSNGSYVSQAAAFGLCEVSMRVLYHPGWKPAFGRFQPGVRLWPHQDEPLSMHDLSSEPAHEWQWLLHPWARLRSTKPLPSGLTYGPGNPVSASINFTGAGFRPVVNWTGGTG